MTPPNPLTPEALAALRARLETGLVRNMALRPRQEIRDEAY